MAGFIFFSCAVLYVVSKRVGLLKLQRKMTAAIKAGMVGQEQLMPGAIYDGLGQIQVNDRIVPEVENMPANIPGAEHLHDEL